MPGYAEGSHLVLIDAHAHIHRCFEPAAFLDAAARNFAAAAERLGSAPAFDAVVVLTESAGDDAFGALLDLGASVNPGGWRIEPGSDGISLTAHRGACRVVVVAGRQIAAAEDLEVLAVGTRQCMADGGPISEVLERVRSWGALRVIPWGAGKWFFARGRLLTSLMQRVDQSDFFLGDEGGRPVFWPEPRHFGAARRAGIRALPGTDPLPFPDEVGRVGSFGAAFRGIVDPARPGASVVAALRDPSTALTPYGGLETPIRFVRHQIGMQIRKRRRKRSPATVS